MASHRLIPSAPSALIRGLPDRVVVRRRDTDRAASQGTSSAEPGYFGARLPTAAAAVVLGLA